MLKVPIFQYNLLFNIFSGVKQGILYIFSG